MEQAPLSQSIQRLEKWLGVALFERSGRGTRLTRPGTVLIEEARRAVLQFDRATSAARRAGGNQRESITVGFVTAGMLRLLPLAIRSFNSELSQARIQLLEASTTDLLHGVANGELDLALVHPIDQPAPGVVLEELKRDRTVAALPRAHLLANRRSVAMGDLADEPMIFFPRSASPGLYARFHAFFDERGISPRIEQEARFTPTILSLVGAGLGYALVQESAASISPANVAFLPIRDLPADLAWVLALAWRPESASAATQAFVRILRNLAS